MKKDDLPAKILDEKHELLGLIRNVGFYHSIKSGGQTVHVETEVTVDSEIKITTKTWTDGSMVDMIVRIFEPPEENIVPILRASAESQHNQARKRAQRGK